MAHPTYPLLALWLVIMSVCSAQSTYYVKPTPDTVCPTPPCLTLSQCVEWANGHLFPSNTTLVFLPGDHSLESNLAIANASRFVMIADNSAFLHKTTVVCNGLAAFVFIGISDLQIHGLVFRNCGSDTFSTIEVNSVLQSKITNCTIRGSVNSSFFAADSGMISRGNRLDDNNGLGLKLLRSTAKLFGNLFTSNRGGGLESINSTVVLIRSNSFVNNSADTRGGGILASGSIIYLSGSTTFIGNRAEEGGGIYLKDTTVACKGTISFLHNTAYHGGGMVATRSNVSLSGQNTFVNNSATDCISESETNVSSCSYGDHFGGGVVVWKSTLYLKGNTTFEGNSATYSGGGIELEYSKLFIEGESRFMTNSAAEVGGGMTAQNTSIHLIGSTTFTSNLAGRGGGMNLQDSSLNSDKIYLEDTTVACKGTISFLYNSAYDGGGMYAKRSNVSLSGQTNFVNNSATDCIETKLNVNMCSFGHQFGGGVAVWKSNVYLKGNTTFEGNSATYGGGIYLGDGKLFIEGETGFMANPAEVGGGIMAVNTKVHLTGNTTFMNNLASEQGGGIFLGNSCLNCNGYTSFVNNLAGKAGGGVVLFNSSAELRESSYFMNNSAIFGGGISALTNANVSLAGSTIFTGNSGLNNGGGIRIQHNCFFKCEGHIMFANNQVGSGGGGLFILSSTVKLIGSIQFVNNSADLFGGGIFTVNSSMTLYGITNLTQNFAISIDGGGIFATSSTMELNGNNYITENFANYSGGGIRMLESNMTLHGSMTLLHNTAEFGGGVSTSRRSYLTLSGNIRIASNSALYVGGGIDLEDSNLNCEGSLIFANNQANNGGGGMRFFNSTVTIEGNINSTNNTAILGGGFYVTSQTHLTLSGNNTFTSNSAIYGGGFCVDDSKLSCEGNTSFVRNLAEHAGGGLKALKDSVVKLKGRNSFINNSAEFGGGVASNGSSLIFRGSTTYISNLATYGGGIDSQYSTVTSYGYVSFANNVANYEGGGIRAVNSRVEIEGSCNSINNSAHNGGGVLAISESVLIFNGNTFFTRNSATYYGGGIILQESILKCVGHVTFMSNNNSGIVSLASSVTFDAKSSFVNNSAVDGAGIYLQHSVLNCKSHIHFENNIADQNGGGLVSLNGTVYFGGGSSFVNNSAHYSGGGVAATNGSNLSWRGNSSFTNNSAIKFGYGGGIQIHNSNMSIEGYMTFTNNFAGVGGGLDVRGLSHLYSTEAVRFVYNSAEFGGGTFCTSKGHLEFRGVNTFVRNTANYGGGAMAAMSGCTVYFTGNNTFIRNSADYGGAAHLINTTVTFTGRSLFLNNSAGHGGGIHSRMVTLRISDLINFTGNSATTSGGGLSLAGSSQCILSPHTTVYLSDNHAAQYGGAIFVVDDPFLYCSYDLTNLAADAFHEQCFFQLPKLKLLMDDNGGVTVHIILQNNFAEEAGLAVYGGMLDRCYLTSFYNASLGAWFDKVFTIIDVKTKHKTTGVSAISSDPIQVCLCYNGYINCSKSQINITAFPGETFAVHVVGVGQRNGIVPSLTKSSLNRSIATLDDLQDAQSAGTKCTPLQYRVFSENRVVVLQLYADGVCLEQGRPLSVNITILPCPIAFELSDTTKGCVCEKRLRRYTDKCNITTGMIEHTGEIWVGRNDYGTILHPHCPFDYCRAHRIRFAMNETDLQCNYERRGLLCGDCQPGLSLVLGTSRCLHCGNVYLLLLIGFTIAGIALVILILACRLTVAVGTINGLIFYANIVSVNKSVFLDPSERVLSVFIAWVNLDLGIETCFYDGMDAYERTWLQFIFPAYIWVLVGIIITLGNRYPWAVRLFGRNPVAVLATLFLLSYAKLLNTLIAALSFNYPDGSEVAVWLYNGNLGYLRGKHIPLFIAALLVLIVLFLPYTLFLLLGQWIQARSEMRIFSWINDYRVKPLIDAYHGPFRDEHRYWNGLLLVVRCCLFLVFAFNALGNPNVNLLTIVTSTIMLLVLLLFAGGRIYKNWYLQALDVSYIVNIGILAAATYYVRCAGGNQTALAYVSVGIALLTFIGIVVYHAITQIKGSHTWRRIIAPKLQRRQRQWVAVPTEPPPLPPTVPHLPTRSIVDLSALIREDETNL